MESDHFFISAKQRRSETQQSNLFLCLKLSIVRVSVRTNAASLDKGADGKNNKSDREEGVDGLRDFGRWIFDCAVKNIGEKAKGSYCAEKTDEGYENGGMHRMFS